MTMEEKVLDSKTTTEPPEDIILDSPNSCSESLAALRERGFVRINDPRKRRKDEDRRAHEREIYGRPER